MINLAAVSGSAGPILDLPQPRSRWSLAVADLVDGLRRNWHWSALAQQDIRLRYRGSVIGPFWHTLTMAIMIVAMGLIYSRLFHQELRSYLPMVTVGLVFWTFIAGLINEGCGAFTSVQGIIQQVKLPFSLHVYRLVYRNLLVLGHNFVIIPLVLVVFLHPVDWPSLLLLPIALLLVILNGIWLSVFLGMVSARFRDVPPIIASIVQVAFFMTPVMWPIEALGGAARWAQFNPLFAMIDVLRSPLLAVPTAPYSWPLLLLMTLFGCTGSFAFFVRFRHRLAFWV